MNTEREVGGFRELDVQEEVTYSPDGKVPLEVGRFADNRGVIDFVLYGDKKGITSGIFYRICGRTPEAINFFSNTVGNASFLTWSCFFTNKEERVVAEFGTEGYYKPLLPVFYNPFKRVIRVGRSLFCHDDKEVWLIETLGGSELPGPNEIRPDKIKFVFSPPTVLFPVVLIKEELVVNDEELLNSLLENYNFRTPQELRDYVLKNKDDGLINELNRAISVLSTNFPVVFTTRLPDELSVRRIVDPKSDILEACKEARLYTPELRQPTPEEE